MSNPTWQDITPLPKSILLYFGDDPDYTAQQIEAAYRLLQRKAEEDADNPVQALLGEIKGCDVLAILYRWRGEKPHASDCPTWINEPCTCEVAKAYRGEAL